MIKVIRVIVLIKRQCRIGCQQTSLQGQTWNEGDHKKEHDFLLIIVIEVIMMIRVIAISDSANQEVVSHRIYNG